MNEPHDLNVTSDLLAARLGTIDHVSGSDSTDGIHRGGAASADLPAVPGYRVLREIARGGMGRVLAAFDLGLEREVALKILLPGTEADRFVRESKITARLPHPGIPPVHALGTLADGSPFLAMKLIAGKTLHEELKSSSGPEGRPRLLQAFTQVCQAVGFAHSRGVIHRDLKPGNVMVGAFGEVQVMDWGLAKDLRKEDEKDRSANDQTVLSSSSSLIPHPSSLDETQAGAILGTPAFMAPEQARGEAVDARADVFALGAILCVILTGRPPFGGDSVLEVIQRAAGADLGAANARLDGCGADADLVALCRRCLNPNPADRPANGQEVADGLTTHLAGVQERLQAVERERAVAVAREAEQRKRRRVQFIATAAVVLVLAAGVAVSAYFAVAAMNEAQRAKDAADGEATQKMIAEREAAEARVQERLAKKNERQALIAAAGEATQKTIAEREAAEAKVQERLAKKNELVAKEHERLAKEAKELADRRAYGAGMLLVQSAWEHDQVDRFLQFLEAERPRKDSDRDHRAFEWYYWKNLFSRGQFALQGHTSSVSSMAFSPDSKRLAAGDYDGKDATVRVWDVQTGQVALSLVGHKGGIAGVAFSPDGTYIASAGYDSTVRVWDAQSGKETAILTGHKLVVECVCFSPDSRLIASGSWDGTAKVWDVQTGQATRTLVNGVKGALLRVCVMGVCFSPDGKRLVTGAGGLNEPCNPAERTYGDKAGELKVWDVQSGEATATCQGHRGTITSVAFSPDGQRIASGAGGLHDHTVRLWDANTGQELRTFKTLPSDILSVCFSPDGKRIVSGCEDKTIKVWDAQTGEEAFVLKGHRGRVNSVCFSPDGKRIASGSCFDRTVKVWDAQAGQDSASFKVTSAWAVRATFSPDGKHFASVGSNSDITVRVWEAETGKEVAAARKHSASVTSVAFSPDGLTIATCGVDRTVVLWDWKDNKFQTLSGHTDYVPSVVFSPDGKFIASAGWDKMVKVWDAQTGKEVFSRQGDNPLSSAAFSQDRKRVLSGGGGEVRGKSYPAEVVIWDIPSGQKVATLKGHTKTVLSLACSADGKRIASAGGDGQVKVWDALTGAELFSLRGHTDVESVAFSFDSERMVTAGATDRSVKVWDAQTGQELLSLKEYLSIVRGAAFSRDGKRILSVGDSHVKIWDGR